MSGSSLVPNPWIALEARTDLVLVRAAIAEPARYYDGQRTIVIRRGLMLCQERRELFHELVHSDRGDEACTTNTSTEASVERAAARWAMPLAALEWAAALSADWAEFSDLLKLPESWVRWRMDIAHPAEVAIVRNAVAAASE